MLLVALLVSLVSTALASPADAAASWRWPLRGDVLTPFRLGPHPFAPGQHRGIDIAATAGARVSSACPGRVTFAGRVPGRAHVVSVACGDLVATYLELASVAVRRGAEVAAGAPLGTVAASHVQLGARRAGNPRAYVDPLTLLRDPAPPPLGAAPWRRPNGPRPRFRAAPRAARDVGGEPGRGIPLTAWGGVALLAAGVPLGIRAHRRRWRSARAVFTDAR